MAGLFATNLRVTGAAGRVQVTFDLMRGDPPGVATGVAVMVERDRQIGIDPYALGDPTKLTAAALSSALLAQLKLIVDDLILHQAAVDKMAARAQSDLAGLSYPAAP